MKAFNATLQEVIYYVLEEWAMMLVEPPESSDACFQPDSDYFAVIATYHGVFDGTLTILAQTSFVDTLADNLLGLDEGAKLDQENKLDALKELANVVSGNFLVEAFGKETVFELPSFETFCTGPNEIDKFLNDAFVYCVGDDELVALNFDIHGD